MSLVKYNNNSISAITTPGALATGAMVLIKEQTASSSSTISFVDGTSDVVLDNTYPIYLFHFINMHPATDAVTLQFNLSVDSGSNYNVAKTTTQFRAEHDEGGSSGTIVYRTGNDLAEGTGSQKLGDDLGNDNDSQQSGYLYLFNPSSTTYVKNFLSQSMEYNSANRATNCYAAGYGNTTSAVDAVQFSMSSGNIDAGKIKLYGLKDS